jgi:zinc D-Ala-D-Ala carboxypeptidase
LNFNITSNFTNTELSCHCGCGVNLMSVPFVGLLQKIRDNYGKPMIVTSAYRCKAYNDSIPGAAPESWHCKGLAVDIACQSPLDRYRLIKLAIDFGITGIGVSSKFLHFDIGHADRMIWTY